MSHKVLIVDGQRGASRLLRSALETIESGLVVSNAQSGEEAMLEILRTRFDLLVTDYLLPGMNGLELKKKFLASNHAGRVIMTLGMDDPKIYAVIKEAAPDAFFKKPIPMSDFLVAVEDCLGLVGSVRRASDAVEVANPPGQNRPGVGDLLVQLRHSLQARAVLLMDASGAVVAEAGQIRGADNQFPLLTALRSLYASAQNAAVLIDQDGGDHVTLFSGSNLDAVFIPVGYGHALLLVGKALANAANLSHLIKLLQPVQNDLLEALRNIGLVSEVVSHEAKVDILADLAVAVTEEASTEFLNIFNQANGNAVNVDDFWESAVRESPVLTASDQLTYEQASRLGLAPDSSEHK